MCICILGGDKGINGSRFIEIHKSSLQSIWILVFIVKNLYMIYLVWLWSNLRDTDDAREPVPGQDPRKGNLGFREQEKKNMKKQKKNIEMPCSSSCILLGNQYNGSSTASAFPAAKRMKSMKGKAQKMSRNPVPDRRYICRSIFVSVIRRPPLQRIQIESLSI